MATLDDDESGKRHRFETHQRDKRIDQHPQLQGLADWCERFDEQGLTPVEGGASAGNLSFRTTAGFVITPTRSRLKAGLSADHFLEVVRVELLGAHDFRVHFLGGGQPPREGGRIPSSDTLMHHLIYCARPDVQAVFHGHDAMVLARQELLGVPVTGRATQFGTVEDARETVRCLADEDYMIRREHGFLSVGRTMRHAGELALRIHHRALALSPD